jgi:hypothetical protein
MSIPKAESRVSRGGLVPNSCESSSSVLPSDRVLSSNNHVGLSMRKVDSSGEPLSAGVPVRKSPSTLASSEDEDEDGGSILIPNVLFSEGEGDAMLDAGA